jgi:aminoglycoside 3-N-acetyltransferase
MSEAHIIETHSDAPITRSRIVRNLREMGLQPGMTVIVHSALSTIGWVCGGAVALILALEEVLEDFGTLVMPTHSGDLSDPSLWENPPVPESWWEEIRETMPAFDPDLTPTRGVGVVPEVFRKQRHTVRSNHPTVSFAAWGEDAIEVVADHRPPYSLGESSPLGRLYDENSWVLLIGAPYGSNTSFHLAEYRSTFRSKETVRCSSPITVEGHRRWITYEDINYNSDDFEKLGADFEKRHEQEIMFGKIGHAESRLFKMRSCVDFAEDWLPKNRR